MCSVFYNVASSAFSLFNRINALSQELQGSLHREREQHEQELSSIATRQSEQRTGDEEEVGWRERCAELQAEVASLTQGEVELAATREMNSQLQNKLRVLVRDKDELEERLAESVCALEREKDSEVLRLDSEKLRLEAELRGLQGSIANHQDVINKLQEEHSLAQNEIKLLRHNIEALEGQVTAKEATLTHQQREDGQRTQDITPTQAELNTLSEQVTHLQQEMVDITSRNNEEKETLEERFKVQDANTKQQLLEKDRIIQELTASLEEVKGRLAERDVTRDTLSRELGRKEEEVSKYSKQLIQLRAHLLEVSDNQLLNFQAL